MPVMLMGHELQHVQLRQGRRLSHSARKEPGIGTR